MHFLHARGPQLNHNKRNHHPVKHAFKQFNAKIFALFTTVRFDGRATALKELKVVAGKAVCSKRLPKMSIVLSLLALLLNVHMCYSALSPTG